MRSFVLLLTTIICLSFGQLAAGVGPRSIEAAAVAGYGASAWSAPQPRKDDVLTRSVRPLVQVAPAPVSGRLPAVPPGVAGLPRRTGVVAFERGLAQKCSASGHEQIRLLRRIPRMESGDPPRV